jgi:heme exporter protein CcmD
MSGLIPEFGKYAPFIWGALGAGVVSMIALALASWLSMARQERAAEEMRKARRGRDS